MITFSHRTTPVFPARALASLLADARQLCGAGEPPHDSVVDLLVRMGELESAVADAMCPFVDDDLPLAQRLRRAALEIGAATVASWRADATRVRQYLEAFAACLFQIQGWTLPERAHAGVQEGFAYYALAPAAYAAAAERFADELRPAHVLCLGVRTIGCSLSAVVGATLRERTIRVHLRTLRPRGDPFDRRPRLSPALRAIIRNEWQCQPGSFVAIVDEGPGLSGSSLIGTAMAIRELGIASERLVLFPASAGDAASFRSERAQQWWPRLRKYVACTAAARVTGRHAELTIDLSGGRWRDRLLAAPDGQWPATNPVHERAKYLVREHTSHPGAQSRIVRFAGFSTYGARAWARARALEDAGFAATPLALRGGYLESALLEGQPCTPDARAAAIPRMAAYLAHLRQAHTTGEAANVEALREMVFTNVNEALGGARFDALERLFRHAAHDEPAVAIDGRMRPHEWISTRRGLFKVDALDHHCDEFYPGTHDIAWDVAGTLVEFGFDAADQAGFVDAYARAAGDRSIGFRLPLYRIAYLAFRTGYAAHSRDTLAGTADGRRFAAEYRRYRQDLDSALEQAVSAPLIPAASPSAT